FRNAHGLTQEGHLSTASDMTIMARRLFYDYPQYYNIFSRRQDDAGIATVRNTNRALLEAYRGADGIKTGYTRAAGFNLVASAERGNVRVIATVFGGQSTAWRNQRIMELMDMGFARAPARVTERRPALPTYGPNSGAGASTGETVLTSGVVSQSLRPTPRPGTTQAPRAPEPALLAAIEAAVGEAIQAAATEAQPAPQAAPDLPSTSADAEPVPAIQPLPRPQAQVETAVTQSLPIPPRPADAPEPIIVAGPLEPEVITRASSSGSRLFGVSLGPQPSHHAAERLLLRTALSEIGTFDQALRRVVQRNGGYEARFQGLTEDQAARACARLTARAIPCEPFGPAS
ncbi:MAG: D-alanyl-D-alanine carboxypeptidase, partial [Proteobacteria bacterium]|nr:D-alanyl-D-alanine carboxypeptidase [Pseudomonadota bacterium]